MSSSVSTPLEYMEIVAKRKKIVGKNKCVNTGRKKANENEMSKAAVLKEHEYVYTVNLTFEK